MLESPLGTGRNKLLVEFSHLYIGILNDYDLISSKLMRGTSVDFEDCVALAKAHKDDLDLGKLATHFHEIVRLDIAENRLRSNIDHFLELLQRDEEND